MDLYIFTFMFLDRWKDKSFWTE